MYEKHEAIMSDVAEKLFMRTRLAIPSLLVPSPCNKPRPHAGVYKSPFGDLDLRLALDPALAFLPSLLLLPAFFLGGLSTIASAFGVGGTGGGTFVCPTAFASTEAAASR